MTQTEAVQIWLTGAKEALETAELLFISKKYNHALFFGQLYLEKLLKGLTYHLKDDHPIFTHNLVLLAEKAGIKLDEKQKEELREISGFNISARYPEDKREIYNRATPEYTIKLLDKVRKLASYFKTYLKK